MGTFVGHEPCPKCGSSDGVGRYTDGAKCFVCGAVIEGETTLQAEDKPNSPFVMGGHYAELANRKITEATCEKWHYQLGEVDGKPCQIANYRNLEGKLVAQKLRFKNKDFRVRGDGKNLPLYGMWLWRDGGKSVTICEGEIDALSVSQAMNNKWPVVSIPNGAGPQAAKCIKEHFEWLDKFDNIVLMFDQDEAGEKALDAVVELLPVGKVKIATLPAKDANETLVRFGPQALTEAYWNAKTYSPVGIVSGADLSLESLMEGSAKGYKLRLPDLSEKLLGLRKGEITLITAASGIGKSTLLRQMIYELQQDEGLRFGNVFLEENNIKTAQAYIALDNNVPLGRLRYNTAIVAPEQWAKSKANVIDRHMWFYNHFGSLESKKLLAKLRYMATALNVDFIGLDHISIVTSGLESSSEGERKDIDILMTNLRSLVEETGVGVVGVVHLKRVKGKDFNEGAQISLTDLRGSASLEQLSDNVIAIERDQQGDESTEAMLRVLKCRETGETGPADKLRWDKSIGRLKLASAMGAFTTVTAEEAL